MCLCFLCSIFGFVISLSVTTFLFFFFNDRAPTEIYPLSLHDALPISVLFIPSSSSAFHRAGRQPLNDQSLKDQRQHQRRGHREHTCRGHERELHVEVVREVRHDQRRSEEHTAELQSQSNLVCRPLPQK